MKTAAKELLEKLEANCPGIITNAREWIGEGWGLQEEATAEQIAAALLMEASDQDGCVERGESSPEYPVVLRLTAYQILRACGHYDPALAEMARAMGELGDDRLTKLIESYKTPA